MHIFLTLVYFLPLIFFLDFVPLLCLLRWWCQLLSMGSRLFSFLFLLLCVQEYIVLMLVFDCIACKAVMQFSCLLDIVARLHLILFVIKVHQRVLLTLSGLFLILKFDGIIYIISKYKLTICEVKRIDFVISMPGILYDCAVHRMYDVHKLHLYSVMFHVCVRNKNDHTPWWCYIWKIQTENRFK